MDIALCTLNNLTYTSAQFSQLPFADIGEKRRSLVCPECGGPAFFRKQTRNGRAACFGARPHQANCSLSVLDETRVIHGQGEIAEVIYNPGERIVVDLVFGAQQHVHAEPNFNPIRGGARAGIHIGDNAANNARMHRRLSTLLRTLIESPAFRNSHQVLEILGNEIEVRDFFVPLLEIQPHHLDITRGFWGMLSDVGVDQSGTAWLNSGGRGNISFVIDDNSFLQVCERFKINEEEDFSGAYILVIGEARLSQNGKIYCSIQDPNMVCIRLV